MSFWQFSARLFSGSTKASLLVRFLSALRRQMDGPLLIIWSGLRVHRSTLVRMHMDADEQDVQLGIPRPMHRAPTLSKTLGDT
jgi:hypothetical protein